MSGRKNLYSPAGLTAILLAGAMLTGCGTTSSLEAPPEAGVIDLTPYARLLVQDFSDEATARAKPEAQPLLKPKLDAAVKVFPDQIASVTRANGGFREVAREGAADDETLILRGAITQYDEGNAALRWVVGFAAGNVNFDARVELVDGASGKTLGTWKVDKNSWALGGGIAATQTPEGFMQEAASKIGTELSVKRKEGQVKRPSGS